jgi:hypothetical protein
VRDEPVTLWPTKRVSQNLVGDAVESIMKILLAATDLSEVGQDPQGPATSEQLDEPTCRLAVHRCSQPDHAPTGWR